MCVLVTMSCTQPNGCTAVQANSTHVLRWFGTGACLCMLRYSRSPPPSARTVRQEHRHCQAAAVNKIDLSAPFRNQAHYNACMCCSSMAIYKVSKVSNIKTASLLPRPACATDICHLHKLPKYKLAVICIDCRCQKLVSIVADMVLHTETILWTHTMDSNYGLILWTHGYVSARRYY